MLYLKTVNKSLIKNKTVAVIPVIRLAMGSGTFSAVPRTAGAKAKILSFKQAKVKPAVLSESELSNLFFGLVKLIKKSAVMEYESSVVKEINYYNDRVSRLTHELIKKEKQIKELMLIIDELGGSEKKITKSDARKMFQALKDM